MVTNVISRCLQMVLIHKTGRGLVHINQEIDIMKVKIMTYISIEYLLINCRSTMLNWWIFIIYVGNNV